MDVRALRDRMAAREADYVAALGAMVNVDCGSYSPAGVNVIADMAESRFHDGGWAVERIPHVPDDGAAQLGDIVIGRRSGTGRTRVLLIGHMDTVFDDGTAAARPFRMEDGVARGPGVSDMKGGLLAGFFAIETLQAAGLEGYGAVTYVCNPDEEIGSPFSRPLIHELAGQHDVAFVLEGARENGDIVSARKGVTDYDVQIRGRAAHAGVEPERGRHAVLQGAHLILALQGLNGRWPGVTVNVGVVEGGTRPNVVPDACRLQVDLRSPRRDTLEEAERAVAEICAAAPTVDGTTVEVHAAAWHRPMERSAASERLVGLAAGFAAELGFDLHDAATGGASDANTTSAAGTPTLDGLGPIGGDDHAPGEWLDLASVVPRTTMLAALIASS